MMRFKHILALTVTAAVLLHGAPRAFAQNSEGDQKETLVNLLAELKADYASALDSDSLQVESRQYREDMAEMVKEANEMTLKLYSQNPEFSFDMAFALDDISALSQRFHDQVGFADKYRSAYRNGLRRYSLLGETLRGMYPVPVQDTLAIADSLVTAFIEPLPETQEDPVKYALLDSCLFYTDALTGMYEKSVDLTLQDSLLYANTEDRLKQAVEYAQSNYEDSQKSMYILENASIVYIIKNWKQFINTVKEDMHNRYVSLAARDEGGNRVSPGSRTWDGSYILAYSLVMLMLLLLAFIIAVLINLVAFKFIKNARIRGFRPILSAILGIVIYVLLMLLMRPKVDNQYWKMSYELLTQFSWLTLAIFVSLLIRIDISQAKASRIYIPPGQHSAPGFPSRTAHLHHMAVRSQYQASQESQRHGQEIYLGFGSCNGCQPYLFPLRILYGWSPDTHILDIPAGAASYHHNNLLPDEEVLRHPRGQEESQLSSGQSKAPPYG